jgi:type IV secretory pathway TraG/TraD family ATPase VirD4
MFFFDVKNEYFPWLQSIVPGHVALIDPFNPKGVAWDIAADCRSVDDCEAIAGLLAPVQDSKEPFFGESVRQWFQGAMVTLHITREGEWTFSEFVRELRSPKAIKKLLEEAPELNRSRIESYFETEKPNRDVLSTLGNRIADLAAVARKWENVREKVSISDWMRGRNPILVFGHSHRNVDAIAALARAFIHRLSQTLLDGENTDLPHSWVFLDEIQTLPKLTELPQLLSKGGSKGVAIAAGYQDIGAMREIYGADLAQSINSYFGFKAFFRTEDPDSAEWASKFFGEARFLVPLMGRSFTDGANPTSSWSVTEHLDKRRIVPPEAFMELPFLDPPEVNAIGSYVIAPVRGGRYPYELTLETIQRFFPEFVQSADPIPSDDELPFI